MGIDYSKYKVLVVDDVKTNVLLLKVMLEKENLQVSTAKNGFEALELLSKDKFDLLLLDIMMPGMTGFELAEKLKSNPEYAAIPILFITALNSTEEVVKGFQTGGSDYITKPFNKDELLMRVHHQISLVHANKLILDQTIELQKTIEGRDRLYAMIAHELRSPISSLKMILNVLSLSAKEKLMETDFREMLDSGNEIAEQGFCLLDNLLKWTKAQLGFFEPMFQNFNLTEIASGVTEVLNPSAKIKKIDLKLVSNDPIIDVWIDIDMMKSILRNLIFNAVKFSYPDSTIIVRLTKEDEYALVEVLDTGCGMSEENQKKLESKISRFSTAGTNKEEGTGLGLLLCKQFVELHNGYFFFESEEGKGSCFGFRIPLARTNDELVPNQ